MKRFLYPSILILSLILFAGCTKETSTNKIPSQTSIEFTHEGQTFQIIPLYDQVLDYTKAVQSDPSKNKKDVYLKKVVEPFQNIASKKKVDIGTHYFPYFSYDADAELLEQNTMTLLKHQKQINEIIKKALIKSAKKLPPHSKKTVFVMPLNTNNNFVISKMEGVSGVTFNQEFILLKIDPSFTEKILKNSVAHEYHHTVKFEEGLSSKVLDSAITEGEAVAFANIVYPDIKAPMDKPLSDQAKKNVLDFLSKNINSKDPNIYYELFNGKPSKGIPLWSNYKIGYEITKSYLDNHPNVPISKWTKLSAKEIVQGSKYSNILRK